MRRHWLGAVLAGFGLAVMIGTTAPAYLASAHALGLSLSELAKQSQSIAGSVAILTGPADRLDTIGGYLSYKVFGTVGLIVAIYVVIQGIAISRGGERKGLDQLWISTGLGRTEVFLDACCAMIVTLLAILVMVYIGTVTGGAVSQANLVGSAVLQVVAIGVIAVTALGFGILLAQFFATTRMATGIACIYLVASYFIANAYQSFGWLSWLKFVSPFYYYQDARSLVPGLVLHPLMLFIPFGAGCAAIVVGGFLYSRRDIDGVVFHRKQGAAVNHIPFHRSRLSRRTFTTSWLTDQKWGILAWYAGGAVFSGMMASIIPSAIRLVGKTGRLHTILERSGVVSHVQSAIVDSIFTFAALLMTACVVTFVASWSQEASSSRIDIDFSLPITEVRYVMERTLQLAIVALGFTCAAILGIVIGSHFGRFTVAGGGIFRAWWDIVLIAGAVGGVGIASAVILRTPTAIVVPILLMSGSYGFMIVSDVLKWPKWITELSIYSAFGTPYLKMPDLQGILYLAGLWLAGTVLAVWCMQRLDRTTT